MMYLKSKQRAWRPVWWLEESQLRDEEWFRTYNKVS